MVNLVQTLFSLRQDTHKSHTGYVQFSVVVSVLLAFIPLLFRLYNTTVSSLAVAQTAILSIMYNVHSLLTVISNVL